MTRTSAIDASLTLKRSLGAGLQAQETMLRAFGRVLGEIPLDGSCPSSLRLIRQPDRPGKIPSLLHLYEGLLPWFPISFSTSWR